MHVHAPGFYPWELMKLTVPVAGPFAVAVGKHPSGFLYLSSFTLFVLFTRSIFLVSLTRLSFQFFQFRDSVCNNFILIRQHIPVQQIY